MPEPRISPTLPGWIRKHLTRYLETDGEDGYLWDSTVGGGKGMIATLLLSTTGRKSGETLTIPLIFGENDDAYVVIASKGGAPRHPAWYHNLMADPNVSVQVKADRFEARARIAEGEERERLWSMMNEIYPPYDEYQAMTDREIPVVVLDRVQVN